MKFAKPNPLMPPRWADRLLSWVCPPELLEELLGDLHEQFFQQLNELGEAKARRLYAWEVIRFCRPYILKRRLAPKPYPANEYPFISLLNPDMIRNFLTITWRVLAQNKLQSFINIIGLAFGMTCFFLISLYLFDELTFDAFHTHSDRIYRITEQRTSPNGKQTKVASIAYNISDGAKAKIPEVEQSTRVSMLGRTNVTNPQTNTTFYKDLWLADAGFTDVFSFPFIAGDPKTALKQPYTAVLTRQMAQQLFGQANPVGKILRTDAFETPFRVTGVCEDVPKNSSVQFDILFSEVTIESQPWFAEGARSDWTSNRFVTFMLLKEGSSPQTVSTKIRSLVAANVKPGQDVGQFSLQPLRDIHFRSTDIGAGSAGDITYVYVFAIIALFVLLIACINYINLTTARASRRLKEIGIRKVSGARQGSLAGQFLLESLLVTGLALLVAVVAVNVSLPAFNTFTEKALTLDWTTDPRIWLGIGLGTLLTALLSGSYPALLLSRFQPALLIKGMQATPTSRAALRQGLVVFQFTLSVIMIVATLVVYLQLRYVHTKDLGFRKDQLVVVDINSGDVRRGFQTIQNEYAKLAGVQQVTVSSRVPGEWKSIPQIDVRLPGSQSGDGTKMSFLGVDEQFLSTFDIRLLAGRNFRPNAPADSSVVLINEAAARALGIKQPLNQLIEIPSVDFNGNPNPLPQPFKARVVGIVGDFHFRSLHESISPLIIGYRINPIQAIDYFTARVVGHDFQQTLDRMDAILQKVDAEHLFEYHFLDQQLELFYREDAKRQTIFILIGLATVFIACLGLFGLVTFTAEQRTKEIGVRKVLGASVGSIVALLSQDFLKLVLVAILIASPIAWWAMHRWLQGFAYHIDMAWWMFVLAALLTTTIALLTVTFQSIKAALVNPVKSLRSE